MRGSVLRGAVLTAALAIPVVASFSPLVSTQAWGDIVHLDNGNSLEGTILEDLPGEPLLLELPSGSKIRLSRSQIARTEATASPAQQLLTKESQLESATAKDLYALAEWCDGKKLRDDAERLRWRVLELDPSHESARLDLGFHQIGAVWLTHEDYHRMRGEVKHNGQWISKAQWQEALAREHTVAKLRHAEELFRTAASQSPLQDRESALAELHELGPTFERWAMLHATESLRWRDRQLAVRELGTLGDRRDAKLLAHIAVTDRKRSVRDEALRALKVWNQPNTVLSFISHLDSGNDLHRINAVRAISLFPDRRAVGPMVATISRSWGEGGRVNFSQLTQRAYVKDYELVSGGTGLVVQEVADPVIDTFMEGVVLDVQVKRIEFIETVTTLRKVTGQNFQGNVKKWQEWWASETRNSDRNRNRAVSEKSSGENTAAVTDEASANKQPK